MKTVKVTLFTVQSERSRTTQTLEFGEVLGTAVYDGFYCVFQRCNAIHRIPVTSIAYLSEWNS